MQGSVSKTEYSDVFAYALLVVEVRRLSVSLPSQPHSIIGNNGQPSLPGTGDGCGSH